MLTEIERKEIINNLESNMLELPQVEFPVEHFFMPGIYIRQMTGFKGHFAIGHEHLTEHTNIIIKGSLMVYDGKESYRIDAPYIFKGNPGRKAAFFLEDTIWLNIHVTDETDLDKLEKIHIKKSDSFIEHENKERIESCHGQQQQ